MDSGKTLGLAALILAAIVAPAAAQRVIDGDTVDIDGTRWRLWGIDAPETPDLCRRQAGRAQGNCRQAQADRGQGGTCELRGHDHYKRSIGLCRAGGEDLCADIVSTGMAWAFTRYSPTTS